MRFWDSSATVPLFTQEAASALIVQLEAADPAVQVWWGYTGHLAQAQAASACRQVDARFEALYVEVAPSRAIRERAELILGIHDLRAADALQLAAFLESGLTNEFVCLDRRLRDAALGEGAVVLP